MAKKPQKSPHLPPKQRRFVEEYLVDLNGAQAAIRAGYSPKTAREQASQILSRSNVQAAIKEEMAKREKRTGIKADYVLKNLVEIVERCMQRAPVCNAKGEQIQDEEGRGVWQFNGRDANKALDLLGKHLGLFQGNGTGRPSTHQEILERYRNGELSLRETALEFEMNNLPLPETIRILLGKEQPEPEDPSAGAYRVDSDEEMERKVAERKAKIEAQIDGLPERRAEVRELRERVTDRFGPEADKPTEEN